MALGPCSSSRWIAPVPSDATELNDRLPLGCFPSREVTEHQPERDRPARTSVEPRRGRATCVAGGVQTRDDPAVGVQRAPDCVGLRATHSAESAGSDPERVEGCGVDRAQHARPRAVQHGSDDLRQGSDDDGAHAFGVVLRCEPYGELADDRTDRRCDARPSPAVAAGNRASGEYLPSRG